MATCTFNDGLGHSITVQAPKYPNEPGREYPQVIGRTMGGGFKIADMGDGSTIWKNPKLQFRFMSAADYAALRAFIEVDVDFASVPFTYTDPYATANANMRYIKGLKEFRQIRGVWHGTIELALDTSL